MKKRLIKVVIIALLVTVVPYYLGKWANIANEKDTILLHLAWYVTGWAIMFIVAIIIAFAHKIIDYIINDNW